MNEILKHLSEEALLAPFGESWRYALHDEYTERLTKLVINEIFGIIATSEIQRSTILEHFGIDNV